MGGEWGWERWRSGEHGDGEGGGVEGLWRWGRWRKGRACGVSCDGKGVGMEGNGDGEGVGMEASVDG